MFFYVICAVIIATVISLCLLLNKKRGLPTWKVLVAIAVMIVTGYLGITILHYIEEGDAGMSFFGSIFFSVPSLWVLCKALKMPFDFLMDLSGPVCAVFLVLSKLNCLYQGCCDGYLIGYASNGDFIYFPSQIIECVNGILIFVILMLMWRSAKNYGCIAPAFLLLFGTTRFVLNFFRANLETFRLFEGTGLFIPKGHLWAAICIIWGIIWMYRARARVYGRKLSAKEFMKSIFGLLPLKECA